MRWFRRPADESGPPGHHEDEISAGREVTDDDPARLLDALVGLDRSINRNAGRLPGWAVVEARWITDTLRAIVASSGSRPLEVTTVLLVRGTIDDYLPTTVDRYAAIGADRRDHPGVDGRSPEELLRGQLEDLCRSVTAVLAAARDQDVDALRTQGSFLRSKFARSDLDL